MIIIDIVLRSSIVMLAAILGSLALARRSAALRHRVLAAGILAAATVMPLSVALPKWTVTIPSSDFIERAAMTIARGTLTGSNDTASAVAGMNARPTSGVAASSAPLAIESVIAAVWAGGATVALALLMLAFTRLARLTHTASSITDPRWIDLTNLVAARHGVRTHVMLLKTATPGVLATWGLRRPCILFPSDCDGWSRARLDVVLSHELAHIARADWPVQIAADVVRAVFWFNPIFWIACARLRRESELACDVAVIAAGTAPNDYAAELLALARTCRASTRSAAAAMSMARPSTLEWRITAMLNTTLARAMGSPRARAIAVAALVAVTIPVATFNATGQAGPLPLTGSVYDVSGAVLPQVAIALEDASGMRSEVTTDSAGRFEFGPVAAGDYWLSTRLPGFRSLRQQVTLRSTRNWERAITLQVGQIQETVTARGEPPSGAALAAPSGRPVRIGGNIRPPRKTIDVRPVYPQAMQDAGYEGVVPMEAVIGVEGTVTSVRVQSTQVHPELADAAVEAVRQWQFTPTLLNGVAVEVSMIVTVQFKLPG